jgi:hypothetical protein
MAISHKFPSSGPSLEFDFAKSKKLDSGLVYTRSSSATYVGSDGLIKIAVANEPRFNHKPTVITNITRRSENFEDNTVWGTSGPASLLITTNAAIAPNGTTTAEKLYEAVFTGVHDRYQEIQNASGTYTFSVYFKAVERYFVAISVAQAGFVNGGQVYFNLNSGTVVSTLNLTTGTNTSGTITAVGNGWYRCSITTTISGTVTVYPAIVIVNNSVLASYAGDGTSGILAWGAQLERNSTVSEYIPSPIASSKTETKVESLGLLIEGPSTNLIDFSEFPAGSWTAGGVGWIALYTPNTTEVFDPEGTNTAAKVYQNGTGWQRITKGINTPDGATKAHTWSLFVKRGNSDVCVIEHTGAWTQGGRVTWNFATETFTTGSPGNFGNYRFERYPNGWYRISATFVPGTTNGNAWIFPGSDYDGASVGAFTYVWGYQLEPIEPGTVITTNADKIALGIPTSYIFCNGAATTRNADRCYADIKFVNNNSIDQHSVVVKSTFNSFPILGTLNRTNYTLVGTGMIWNIWWESGPRIYGHLVYSKLNQYQTTASSQQINTGETLTLASSTKRNEISAIFKSNAIGNAAQTNNSIVNAHSMDIGSFGDNNYLNGSISRLSYYPRRVTNIELREVK